MAADLFADRDLAALGPVRHIPEDSFPEDLARSAEAYPRSPWIYTGALENQPTLVGHIAKARPLLGIDGEALQAVRDPKVWTETLRAAGLSAPDALVEGDDPPDGGAWLSKPLDSASGRGIRPWRIGEGPIPRGRYLQARLSGHALGAVLVGDGRSARLAGVTRQILGRSPDGVRCLYRGSVGPWPIPGRAWDITQSIGDRLASSFGLVGLFGVDVVLSDGVPWPVEINPRYTASVEVLEESLGLDLVAEHAGAFGLPMGRRTHSPRRPNYVAKRIVRASGRGSIPDAWVPSVCTEGWPDIADIPGVVTTFRAGDPILTVFARGDDLRRVVALLARRSARWRRTIAGWSAGG